MDTDDSSKPKRKRRSDATVFGLVIDRALKDEELHALGDAIRNLAEEVLESSRPRRNRRRFFATVQGSVVTSSRDLDLILGDIFLVAETYAASGSSGIDADMLNPQ